MAAAGVSATNSAVVTVAQKAWTGWQKAAFVISLIVFFPVAIYLYHRFNAKPIAEAPFAVQKEAAKASTAGVATLVKKVPLSDALARPAPVEPAKAPPTLLEQFRSLLSLSPRTSEANIDRFLQLLATIRTTGEDPGLTTSEKETIAREWFLHLFVRGLDRENILWLCQFASKDCEIQKSFMRYKGNSRTKELAICLEVVKTVSTDPHQQMEFLADLACEQFVSAISHGGKWDDYLSPALHESPANPFTTLGKVAEKLAACAALYPVSRGRVISPIGLDRLIRFFDYLNTYDFKPDQLIPFLKNLIVMINSKNLLTLQPALVTLATSPLLEKLTSEEAADVRAFIFSTITTKNDLNRYAHLIAATKAPARAGIEPSYVFFPSQAALDQFFGDKLAALHDGGIASDLTRAGFSAMSSAKKAEILLKWITSTTKWLPWALTPTCRSLSPADKAKVWVHLPSVTKGNKEPIDFKTLDFASLLQALQENTLSKEALIDTCYKFTTDISRTAAQISAILSAAMTKDATVKTSLQDIWNRPGFFSVEEAAKLRPVFTDLGIIAEVDGGAAAETREAAPPAAPSSDIVAEAIKALSAAVAASSADADGKVDEAPAVVAATSSSLDDLS